MTLAGEIEANLRAAFDPTELNVINDSASHHGHSGDDGSGESHWHIIISSPAFDGMNRLARHRAIHTAIGPDVIARIHALGIEVR